MFGGNINPAKKPAPPAAPAPAALPPPAMSDQGDGGGGDGFEHFTIDQDDAGFHGNHIFPDGHAEPFDAATGDEAADLVKQSFGGAAQGQPATAPEPDADEEAPDFSATYRKA